MHEAPPSGAPAPAAGSVRTSLLTSTSTLFLGLPGVGEVRCGVVSRATEGPRTTGSQGQLILNAECDNTDAFPTRCEVRGCSTAPEAWFLTGRFTVDVCNTHELELRAGEPHTIVDNEVLAGRDCTGQLLRVRRTQAPDTLELTLGREGISHQEVMLDSTTDLRSALDALRADSPTDRKGPDSWDH